VISRARRNRDPGGAVGAQFGASQLGKAASSKHQPGFGAGSPFATFTGMKAFRLRLEQALGSGAALALLSIPACGGSSAGDAAAGASSAGSPSAGHSGSGTSAAGASGTAPTSTGGAGTGGGSSQQLTPYPVSALGCTGPEHDGGYFGQCCADALCYTPDDGSECVPPNEAPSKLGESYGSGSCLCGGEDSIQGPFAANPSHEPEKAGTCCYVIASIGCEGRPLLVDGAAIVSALTQRCDWVVADLLELEA